MLCQVYDHPQLQQTEAKDVWSEQGHHCERLLQGGLQVRAHNITISDKKLANLQKDMPHETPDAPKVSIFRQWAFRTSPK